MEVKDFTQIEQEQIKAGLPEAVIDDKAALKKIVELIPKEYIKKIPFFVRGHATTKTVEKVAREYPQLYSIVKKEGEIPEDTKEEIRQIIDRIFKEKMEKHNIK